MIVTTDKTGLSIELHGKEQLWALRAKINVLRSTIRNISFESKYNDWRKWEVRMPGTHAPRMLLAGSYWTEEGWDFMYIKRPSKFINPTVFDVLVIETDQDRYKRVIFSCEEAEAKKIIRWWKAGKTKK